MATKTAKPLKPALKKVTKTEAKTMAKPKDMMPKASKGFNFAKFDERLSKIEGFESGSILATNVFSEVNEWIDCGNYMLNAQFSGTLFGGIPNTRSVGFAGDPGSGKTFLCLNIVREAQKKGYFVFYCDTEGAVDREQAANFGIDVERIRYQPIKLVSQFKTFVVNIINMLKEEKKKDPENPPKFMIVLDSIGMLTTDKEQKDAAAGHNAQDMGLKAKELRSLFRNITLDLAEHKIPLIATNHTASGGMMAAKVTPGGDGPIFAFSLLTFLSKSQLKEGETKTGIIVKSKIRKSRFTIPQDVSFHISFYNRMNRFVGLEEFISWENCGIQKGTIMTVKEYTKLKVVGKHDEKFTFDKVDESTGEITQEELVFVPKETARTFAVKHLGGNISPKNLFTPQTFTQEVLTALDENVIKDYFKLPTQVDETDSVASIVETDDEEEGTEE